MRVKSYYLRAAVLALTLMSSTVTASVAAANTEYNGGGFYALYAENRREGIPNLITEDLLLQAYSMVRARHLVAMEREQLLPALELTVAGLHALLSAEPMKYSERNRAYIEILQALLTGRSPVFQSEQATAELALVMAAESVQLSPLWGYSIDYSQLAPRGQYCNDPDLKRYFVASRYASSVLFSVVQSAATGVSEADATAFASQASELSQLLADPSVAPAYRLLTSLLDWQFGAPDDLSAQDVRSVLAGEQQGLAAALQQFAMAENKVPKIIGKVLSADRLEAGLTAQQALIGWRLLPSRLSADAQALQSLVFSDAESLRWSCQDCARPALSSAVFGGWYKSYPSYRELMAGNGSIEAQAWVEQKELFGYSGYDVRAQAVTGLYDAESGLAAQQLKILRLALGSDDSAQALQSGAGFWVWQRYLSRLYQKQSSTPFSKGILLGSGKRQGAHIVANAPLYQALADLASAHAVREPQTVWSELSQLFAHCALISESDEALSEDDEGFLNALDLTLQALTGRDDLPIVTDLHRNYQEQKVLQVALGRPLVVAHRAARGARFQVHEFSQPLSQSLDNLAWRQSLAWKGKE